MGGVGGRASAALKPGDRVVVARPRAPFEAEVIRINAQSVVVVDARGKMWRIPAGYPLRGAGSAASRRPAATPSRAKSSAGKTAGSPREIVQALARRIPRLRRVTAASDPFEGSVNVTFPGESREVVVLRSKNNYASGHVEVLANLIRKYVPGAKVRVLLDDGTEY